MEKQPTKDEVLDAVAEIQGIKSDTGQAPVFAFLDEIANFLRPEYPGVDADALLPSLRTLYREKRIEHHRTVNGLPMFGVTNQTKQPEQNGI